MTSRTRIVLVICLALMPLACSDAGVVADLSAIDGLSRDGGFDLFHDGGRSDLIHDAGRPSACLTQDSKVQVALDAARKSPNALLVIRNTACGTSVYISGDSSTGTASSLWRIGSVTKTYVAATVLTFIREGKLALSDPLSSWISGVPNTDGVTLRMLLNHTSGIFNYTDDPKFLQDPLKTWTPAELLALATAHPPYFAPGTSWHYSNTNYVLLGMLLEKVGAAKASALIRKRGLEPAALTHTFLEAEETLTGTLARGFDQKKNDVTSLYSMTGPWTAGAMVASGADLCDWISTLLGSTDVLTRAEQTTMIDQPVVMDGVTKYGLGVMILDPKITMGAGQALGHGGDIFGFHTQAFWFPDKQTAICAVVNQDGTTPNDLTLVALTTLFGS